jgi:hypothetical protein
MPFSNSSRWLRWVLIGVAVLIAAFVLLVIDSSGALLFRVVGLIGMALFALSVVTMLLTFRKARKLSPWSLVIGAVVSVACTLIFFTLASVPLPITAILLAACAGAMVGVRLVPDEPAVHRRRHGAGARQHLVLGGVGADSADDAGRVVGGREDTLCRGAGFVSRHGSRRRQQLGAAGAVCPSPTADARRYFDHGRKTMSTFCAQCGVQLSVRDLSV